MIDAEKGTTLDLADVDPTVARQMRALVQAEPQVQAAAARLLSTLLADPETIARDSERYARLGARERDVLRLIALGYTAPQVGARLRIADKTVDTYRRRITEKIQLAHRSEYVRFVARLGLLEEPEVQATRPRRATPRPVAAG